MARNSTAAGRVAKTLWWMLLRLVLLSLALAVAASIVVLIVLPRATHGSAMTVLTGSMTPGIPVGSVVMVRPVDPRTLHVGDIATYQVAPKKDEFITHRIVKINTSKSPTEFTFKGDANRGPDLNPVPAGAIRGKVWFHVPYLGAIRDGLHGKGGITLVAMLALGGYAVMQFSGAFDDRKKRRAGDKDQPSSVELDRSLLSVTLQTSTLQEKTGKDRDVLLRDWGGLLAAEDDETFTMLIAPPAAGLVAAIELLGDLGPLNMKICTAPVQLTGQPMDEQSTAALEKALGHAPQVEKPPAKAGVDHA